MAASTWFLLAIAAITTACAPAARNESGNSAPARTVAEPPAPAPVESAYVIRGQPRPNWSSGWVAVKLADRLLLDSPTSAGWYRVTLPEPRIDGGRRIHRAERLTLTVEPGACGLREIYPDLPDRVLLAWDGGEFEGCGGPRLVSDRIAGTVWELVRIGADAAPETRSPAATLVFGSDGSVGGTLNCNDGGLRSRWTGEGGFVAQGGGFEQTAIGCFDAGEAFGRRFWNLMATARAWRRDGERLLVTFDDGTEAELRYLI